MPVETGIKVNGKVYPLPSSFRLGELREIKRITGMNPPEFVKGMDRMIATRDPDVVSAMVWWAVHREDPSFTVGDLDQIELTDISFQAGDEVTERADPKGEGASSANLTTSASESKPSQETVGETTHLNGGGQDSVPSGLLT